VPLKSDRGEPISGSIAYLLLAGEGREGDAEGFGRSQALGRKGQEACGKGSAPKAIAGRNTSRTVVGLGWKRDEAC
jgi:hypothetical protein